MCVIGAPRVKDQKSRICCETQFGLVLREHRDACAFLVVSSFRMHIFHVLIALEYHVRKFKRQVRPCYRCLAGARVPAISQLVLVYPSSIIWSRIGEDRGIVERSVCGHCGTQTCSIQCRHVAIHHTAVSPSHLSTADIAVADCYAYQINFLSTQHRLRYASYMR